LKEIPHNLLPDFVFKCVPFVVRELPLSFEPVPDGFVE
jgi:hypothetical protein